MDRRALLGLAAVAAAAAPAKASSGGGEEPSSGGAYMRLPVVTATLMLANGRRGVLSIETGVDVPDAALRARAQASGPRLRSAYNEAAQRFANGMRPGMAPDIDQLSAVLQAATDTALGRSGARLLLGTVMAL
ncbi:Tat pathway signal protein [Brevundimonas sp.]|uniref:Tat pathway signal protein n=1 Tax=Brevundimonas sp. TaxID=1871086 RepID=UPI0025B8AB30|nr:Tat pathway signal protein [Brevundimonas sp.]